MAQTFLFLYCNIMKHKTEDYKLSTVKYYLSNNFSLDHICSIFECKKSSLKRWIERYNEVKELKRHVGPNCFKGNTLLQLIYII